MRFSIQRNMTIVIIICSFITAPLFTGCEGSDTDRAVKETVEELSGKNIVDKGQKMKQQIDDLSEQEARRVQQEISTGQEDRQGMQNADK